jgi:Glycosyltransferase sugar-binding region containing DXD motif
MKESNRTVHALWIGNKLSKLELLTISSFIAQGHEFRLWTYSDLVTPLPRGVVLCDAAKILPRETVFRSVASDQETGVGKGSFANFSDLFRYKLLYHEGGYWTDMDITCLKPLEFSEPYVFRSHRVGVVGNLMKCPPKSRVMRLTFERSRRQLNSGWHFGNRALSDTVVELGLDRYIRSDICNADMWFDGVRQFVENDSPIPSELYVIHWINEFWRTLTVSGGYYRGKKVVADVPDKDNPKPGSTLSKLYEQYSL